MRNDPARKMTTKPSNESHVKVQTGTYTPLEPMLRAAPLASAAHASDRRRGQRVLLRIRASIHVALKGQPETFNVAMLKPCPSGTRLAAPRRVRFADHPRELKYRVYPASPPSAVYGLLRVSAGVGPPMVEMSPDRICATDNRYSSTTLHLHAVVSNSVPGKLSSPSIL